MPRIDHVAVESPDPARVAVFYEQFLGARIVRKEGHPVMAYLQSGAIAIHKEGGPGTHIAFRVSEAERQALPEALARADIEHEERDHEIPNGLFFQDPHSRPAEAITHRDRGVT